MLILNPAVAEYCTLRADCAVPVPSNMDPVSTAPLLCAGITAFNSIRKMAVPEGDTIAVCGIGGLGHLAVQYARNMGYRTVAVSGTEDKREAGISLGTHAFVNTAREDPFERLTQEGGASLVIVFWANPAL